MTQPEPHDIEIEDEPVAVRLPRDRGVVISIRLSHAEATTLFDLADAAGVNPIQAARDILLRAMAREAALGGGVAALPVERD